MAALLYGAQYRKALEEHGNRAMGLKGTSKGALQRCKRTIGTKNLNNRQTKHRQTKE
jgi:hypothetical protein